MKTKVIIAFVLSLLFAAADAYALSAEDVQILKLRAREKVKQLNDYISFMADKKKPAKTRYYYKDIAQTLFINNCDGYKEITEFEDGTQEESWHDGVVMEVASTRNQIPRTKPMKTYFRGLITMNYTSVTIETTDIADMRVSELKPYGKDENGNTLYICSVIFDQVFIGQRADGGIYKDITRKWVVCYVKVDEVYNSQTGETESEYMVSLGDVHVISVAPF